MPFDLKKQKDPARSWTIQEKGKKTYDQWFGLSSKPVLT